MSRTEPEVMNREFGVLSEVVNQEFAQDLRGGDPGGEGKEFGVLTRGGSRGREGPRRGGQVVIQLRGGSRSGTRSSVS